MEPWLNCSIAETIVEENNKAWLVINETIEVEGAILGHLGCPSPKTTTQVPTYLVHLSTGTVVVLVLDRFEKVHFEDLQSRAKV